MEEQTPVKMEARRKRKPLSDCTNTTITTTSSSSSIKKPYTDPTIASVFKKLLNSTSGQTVTKSNPKHGSTANATSENNPELSAGIDFTPAKSSRVYGTSGKLDLVEPCSVYSRKSTANKRKSKDKAIAMPLMRSLEANINTAGDENKEDGNTVLCKSCTGHRRNFFDGDKSKEDGNTVLSKSCPAHQRKKEKHEPQHALPQDFIEKQRAYFAEIDAFELAEEEVESADQLE